MARYRGPKLRITRRLGTLPGLTQKKSKKKIDRGNTEKITMGIRKKQQNMVYVLKKNKN